MKPALSVIFFTVSSGAGLGLAVWLLLAQLAGQVDASHPTFWIGAGVSAVLLTVGLLSSTAHLANPRNAWRSFSRFRSSWLSREGVLSVAFYPLALLHLYASTGAGGAWRVTAVLLIALALAIVVSTAMIYACLKTVPRWRTWHTPVGYLLYALACGGLLWAALATSGRLQPPSTGWLFAPVVAVALVKLLWDAKFSARVHATLNDALAVPTSAPKGQVQGRVRLLDPGHTHGTFLTNEFGFVLARERAASLRATMFALGFAVPLLALFLLPGAPGLWVAAIAVLGSALVERWLFFARAEHVVRLYHGQQRV